MDKRVVFMGSPEFALDSLKALNDNFSVVGVITQPHRLAGRGRKLHPPAIYNLATELGLDIYQPKKLRSPEAMEMLKKWQPDVIVVAAYGQILRKNVLEMPEFGCVNVHASLLPRWRGAAPINAAIYHGDSESGITIMKMDPGVDTGPILSQKKLAISNADTAGSLSIRLASLGAELLIETLPRYLNGEINAQDQNAVLATKAPMLKKDHGELNFNRSAKELALHVRGYNPWPGAFTFFKDKLLKIHFARAVDAKSEGVGKRTVFDNEPAIHTINGLLVLEKVQISGKQSVKGKVFLHGARDWEEI